MPGHDRTIDNLRDREQAALLGTACIGLAQSCAERWVAEGRLRPHIDRTWPLADAAQALQYVLDRHARGKCMLTVGDDR